MQTEALVLLIVVVLVVAAAGVGTLLLVRRHRWKQRIGELGWSHDANPGLDRVLSLGNPPFDCGFRRSIDEAVTGRTSTSWAFGVFDYDYRGGGPRFSARVAIVALPMALPELYLTGREVSTRTGVRPGLVPVNPQLDATVVTRAEGPRYAAAVLTAPVREQLSRWAATAALDLSIDHGPLVALGAPKDPKSFGRSSSSWPAWLAPWTSPRCGRTRLPPRRRGWGSMARTGRSSTRTTA